MAYLIVRLKLTTIEKVVSLMNKLEKYDIVESVESHSNEAAKKKDLGCCCAAIGNNGVVNPACPRHGQGEQGQPFKDER